MQYKHTLRTVCFLIALAIAQSVNAEAFYTVSYLRHLCRNRNPGKEAACRTYLHGVVETWMIKDLVSVDPRRFENRVSNLTFCESIYKVSENEWVEIVRSNLNAMKPGFAADAVMQALAKNLCTKK
jgi:hypothetical protein